jgi:hypothetical protein
MPVSPPSWEGPAGRWGPLMKSELKKFSTHLSVSAPAFFGGSHLRLGSHLQLPAFALGPICLGPIQDRERRRVVSYFHSGRHLRASGSRHRAQRASN